MVLVALLLALAPHAEAALWYESYEAALEAIEREDWDEAIAQLGDALEKKGDSSARARTYGVNFRSYFPYFQLGIAYYNLGQLDAAEQAFETEQRLGAIARSSRDQAKLEQFRQLIVSARDDAAARQVIPLFDDSMGEARRLQRDGELDGALAAVGRALALTRDREELQDREVEARSLMEQIRLGISERRSSRLARQRANDLFAEGRSLFDAGEFRDAAARLGEAVAAGAGEDAQQLLDRSLAAVRDELRVGQDAQRLERTIRDALGEAGRFADDGRLVEALEQLQAVLALDPGREEAIRLQADLRERRAREEAARVESEQLARLLAEAERQFDAGAYEASLAAANRALGIDPTNRDAIGFAQRTYPKISAAALERGFKPNLRPSLKWADDLRVTDESTGRIFQRVGRRRLRLSGRSTDESEVTIGFEALEYGDRVPDDPETGELLALDAEHRFDVEPARIATEPIGNVVITDFSLERLLRPGWTVLRVTATDAEDERSAAEYWVYFEPAPAPLWATPWPYVVGFALVAALLWARVLGRARRRRELLRRKYNPYTAGAPILKEELFIGRERLMDKVLQSVHNNSILLYGERRIGKTSFQHRLQRRLAELDDPEFTFFSTYIDLQGVRQEEFFAKMAEDVSHELEDVLDGFRPDPSIATPEQYGYRQFTRDVKRILKALSSQTDKKVKLVLQIDEVDALNDYDPAINQQLRSLFMKSFSENLVAVVSGVEISKHWETSGSPWYNFFEEIRVEPFRPEDARELVERPIRGIFSLEDGVTDRVLELTDCKPYLIQKLCIALVGRLHDGERTTITLEDVEAIGRPAEA